MRNGPSRDALAEAQEYFADETRKAGLKEPIERAHSEGARREARTVNVFVHPEFAWFRTVHKPIDRSVHDSLEVYRTRISQALASPDASVVITFDCARDVYDGFVYDDALAIPTPDPTGNGTVQGMLDVEGMRRFVECLGSIRPDDRFLIHGSAFNRCPTHFAKQLLGLSIFGIHMPVTHAKTEAESPESRHQRTVLEALYHSWYIVRHTRIRLGIQHNTCDVAAPDSLTQDLCEDGITKVFPALASLKLAQDELI